MTCIKKGLSELTLRRPRSSIMEVKSALPVPLFRLFLSFFVLRVLNCSCYVSVKFGQEYLWTLTVVLKLFFHAKSQ